ncbi:prepilin-type N-terminal cleavage/methylation domain-containing protein [Puniceicoccus vermicola]
MRKKDAFTLIELLTVIAVIAILAAISFGITSGVYQRQARTKAAAELSALSAALESYRAQYGTYPITNDPGVMLKALANRVKWDGPSSDDTVNISERRPFIEPSKYDIAGTGEFWNDTQTLVDPWGNGYHYEFSTGSSWKRFGFILFSDGPDGTSAAPVDGIMNKDHADNADNIYAGSN